MAAISTEKNRIPLPRAAEQTASAPTGLYDRSEIRYRREPGEPVNASVAFPHRSGAVRSAGAEPGLRCVPRQRMNTGLVRRDPQTISSVIRQWREHGPGRKAKRDCAVGAYRKRNSVRRYSFANRPAALVEAREVRTDRNPAFHARE